MTDAAALKEALNDFRPLIEDPDKSLPIERYKASLRAIFAAAEAHLATLPRTRMQEVWRVEYVYNGQPLCAQYQSREAAESRARERATASAQCIRVVSAQQEVPEA